VADRDLTVYRTRRPEIVAIWDAAMEARKEWAEKVKAFQAEHGLRGREVYCYEPAGHIAGFSEDGSEPPAGWRVDQRRHILVPRLSTRPGKAIGEQLGTLKQPDPRNNLPGMPAECFAGLRLLTCGLALRENGSALYVTWSAPIDEKRVDLDVWEQVKLSEYYAVLEVEVQTGGAS
jgi:hypothetical protein